MATCKITGTVTARDGVTPVEGAVVEVVRVVADDALPSSLIPPQAVTDENGDFELDVWRGASAAYFRCWDMPDIEGMATSEGLALEIPDAPTAQLKDLLPATDPPPNAVTSSAFNNHVSKIASADELGHVRIGSGLLVDEDGVLSAEAEVTTEQVQDALTGFFNSTTPALHADYDDVNNQLDLSIDNADSDSAGLMSAADKTKLDGIATGATANTTDAQLRDRSTHTGTQAASTITGLEAALDTLQAHGEVLDTLGTAAVYDAPPTGNAEANELVKGDDTRLTNARTPSGGAGGVLSGSYPNPGFAVDMAEQSELNATNTNVSNLTTLVSDLNTEVSDLSDEVDAKAPLDSPAFTGNPTAPTQTAGNNTTRLATTAFVTGAVASEASTRAAADTALTDALADEAADRAAADALLAPLASPALTGTPTAPTAAAATSTTQIATTAFVQAVIAAAIDGAPGALDTLNELAAALGDDPNFAATITNALAGKLAKASNLSDLVDAAAARVSLGLVIGTNVQAYSANLDAWAGKTAPTGTVIGSSDTQTLSNKTLASPAISNFSNATHGHTNSAGGGLLTEAAIGFSDNTTGDASSGAHGFMPKLSGDAADVFKGDGSFGQVDAADITGLGTAAAEDAADLLDRGNHTGTQTLSTISDAGALAAKSTVATGDIDADAVTYAKMQNVSAASKLLGRGSAGGAGDPEEITLGTGLSMSGTTLNAAAGGDTLPVADTTAIAKGSADATKLLRFEVDGLTTGTTRVVTVPDSNTTLPIISQVVTVSGPTAARTYTFPDANATIARTDAAQTFTGAQTFSGNLLANTDGGSNLGAQAANRFKVFAYALSVNGANSANGEALFHTSTNAVRFQSGFTDFGSAQHIRFSAGDPGSVGADVGQKRAAVGVWLDTDGSSGWGKRLSGRAVTAKTSGYTVLTTDVNTFFTNTGAAGGVTFTLPTPAAGLTYEFYRDADQTVTLDVAGAVTIRSGASVTSAGGQVTLDAVGTRVRLVAISTTQWVAEVTGTVTFS